MKQTSDAEFRVGNASVARKQAQWKYPRESGAQNLDERGQTGVLQNREADSTPEGDEMKIGQGQYGDIAAENHQ